MILWAWEKWNIRRKGRSDQKADMNVEQLNDVFTCPMALEEFSAFLTDNADVLQSRRFCIRLRRENGRRTVRCLTLDGGIAELEQLISKCGFDISKGLNDCLDEIISIDAKIGLLRDSDAQHTSEAYKEKKRKSMKDCFDRTYSLSRTAYALCCEAERLVNRANSRIRKRGLRMLRRIQIYYEWWYRQAKGSRNMIEAHMFTEDDMTALCNSFDPDPDNPRPNGLYCEYRGKLAKYAFPMQSGDYTGKLSKVQELREKWERESSVFVNDKSKKETTGFAAFTIIMQTRADAAGKTAQAESAAQGSTS